MGAKWVDKVHADEVKRSSYLGFNHTDYIRYGFTTHNVVNQPYFIVMTHSYQQFINCHMFISCQVRE